MQTLQAVQAQARAPSAQRPFHAGGAASEGLLPADVLVLPLHRRMVTQYSHSSEGGRELRLYYGDKEISFDDPTLFAFGEQLSRQDRFSAARSTIAAAAVVACGQRLPDTIVDTEELHPQIGDRVAPRTIHEAILEGRRAAQSLR